MFCAIAAEEGSRRRRIVEGRLGTVGREKLEVVVVVVMGLTALGRGDRVAVLVVVIGAGDRVVVREAGGSTLIVGTEPGA